MCDRDRGALLRGEDLPGITDSLAVHLEDDEGGPGELILLVVTEDGGLDDERRRSIASAVKHALHRGTSRTIAPVRDIPRNLTGKKPELPSRRSSWAPTSVRRQP